MPDNPVTPVVDNPVIPDAPPAAPAKQAADFSWKSRLLPDYAGSPTIQLFPDTVEGFNDAVKSHLGLVRLVGNEKVPIPRGKDDVLGREVFNKALGVPDSPDGYVLKDANMPESMKGLTFDKATFAKTIHAQHLTPDQANGLWEAYTKMTEQTYANALKAHQDKMTQMGNELRQEWGDAYKSKVDLGQMVINKFFTDSKEMEDWWTATVLSNPHGIKGLEKLGQQFTENKIGEFKYQRHSLSPDEAQREIDSIRNDPTHPYSNPKATERDHEQAVKFVNSLYAVVKNSKGQS